MGKKWDLSDFERDMVVGARRLVWVFQKLLVYWDFHTQPSQGFTEKGQKKKKISSERQLWERKCLVDVRGQRRMDRLVRDDRKATVTQINTRYSQGMQNTISEHTTRRTLKQDNFLAHFGPLSTNWASVKRHSLPEYCCWPCLSLYDYSVHIFWWLFPAG